MSSGRRGGTELADQQTTTRAAPEASHEREHAGLLSVLGRNRFFFQAGIDGAAWGIGLVLAALLRYDFSPGSIDGWGLLLAVVLAVILQVAIGAAVGLYRGRWRFGGFDEVATLVQAIVLVAAVLFVVNVALLDRAVPASVPVMAGVIALVLSAGTRYTWRLFVERRLRPDADKAVRLLVFGAGEGGEQVVRSMMRNPDSPYVPVAFLDDDPHKRELRFMGVPVLGTRQAIARVAEEKRASALLIAIPSAAPELIRDVSERAAEAGLETTVLPPVAELIGGTVNVADIRPLTEEDLLGRHQVEIDVDSIAGYVTGKRVLVTGAGGSIGSELCRQLTRFAPERLVLLDRDESGIHGTQLLMEGRATLDSPDLVVADLRDRPRMEQVFADVRPQVVFHAAALKHLPLLELHPEEAVKTNVWGTQLMLELSLRQGVERFVNISTDKAADPISVLGYSKRIAERLTAHAANLNHGVYISVRFGNVLGSRGSVLRAFEAQIEAGGPVTVTDPEVTRYFMTVEEATRLVIQAGAVGRDGEALVLDMGEPVRIAEVAERLVEQAGRPVEIVYTGLRRGEKLHEVLLGKDEPDERPFHPLISHVPVPPLDPAELDALRHLCNGSGHDPRTVLVGICGSTRPVVAGGH